MWASSFLLMPVSVCVCVEKDWSKIEAEKGRADKASFREEEEAPTCWEMKQSFRISWGAICGGLHSKVKLMHSAGVDAAFCSSSQSQPQVVHTFQH